MTTPVSLLPHAPAVFLAQGRAMRAMGSVLRTAHRLAPGLGTRLALRVFLTPMPLKFATARRPIPGSWTTERWPFEGGDLVAYRRNDIRPGLPKVLLVHGWAGHGLQMAQLGDALAAAGLDPVLLDFPGHGRSRGMRSTLPQFVRGIWAASARLGPLQAIVAHSMGAMAAAHAAASGLPVSRLVLLSCAPPPSQLLRWFANSFKLNAALPERMRLAIEQLEPIPLDHFEAGWLGPRLWQPTLVIHDQADRTSPVGIGEQMAASIARARWHTTSGLGHNRLLADADVADRVVAHITTSDVKRPNQSAM